MWWENKCKSYLTSVRVSVGVIQWKWSLIQYTADSKHEVCSVSNQKELALRLASNVRLVLALGLGTLIATVPGLLQHICPFSYFFLSPVTGLKGSVADWLWPCQRFFLILKEWEYVGTGSTAPLSKPNTPSLHVKYVNIQLKLFLVFVSSAWFSSLEVLSISTFRM